MKQFTCKMNKSSLETYFLLEFSNKEIFQLLAHSKGISNNIKKKNEMSGTFSEEESRW